MTRSAGEVQRARELFEQGIAIAEVARRAGIPRSTVREWIKDGFTHKRGRGRPLDERCDPCPAVLNLEEEPYAYLLGLYLGDGCISALPRTYKLRITLDEKYPNIVSECKAAMAAVLPNRVGKAQKIGCVEIMSHSQHWPCLFPQHGAGRKHLRTIALEPWQQWIAVERNPKSLLRGLIHSDGCRAINTIRAPYGTYSYPRYQFSNRSAEIRAIFTLACGRAGIECRPSNAWTVSVSKMSEVARMDEFIGPKT